MFLRVLGVVLHDDCVSCSCISRESHLTAAYVPLHTSVDLYLSTINRDLIAPVLLSFLRLHESEAALRRRIVRHVGSGCAQKLLLGTRGSVI